MWLASALWPPWGLDRTTGIPPAYIIKPAYFFVIAGIDRKATEACAEYLALPARMLAEFKAAHPRVRERQNRCATGRESSDDKDLGFDFIVRTAALLDRYRRW